MSLLRSALAGLALTLLIVGLSPPAGAVPPAQTPAAAQPFLPAAKPAPPSPLAPLASQINQQFKALVGTSSATAPAGAAPAATSSPGAAPSTPAPEETGVLPETFGTRSLNLLLTFVDLLAAQGNMFLENFADVPQVTAWFDHQANDSYLLQRWAIVGHDLLIAVGAGLAAALLLELLLWPARGHLRRRRPTVAGRKLGAVLGLMGLGLLPIILFVGVALALLDQDAAQKIARFAVLNVIYALALSRFVMVAGRALLAPRAEAIRLMPLSSPQANYLYRWLGFFSFVTVYGYFCIDAARLLHVPDAPVRAFSNLLGLILVLMTITVIVQKRSAVAVFLRGGLSAARPDVSILQSLRLWLARRWHILAIAYLLIGYLVTALGVEGGFALLLRGTMLTLVALAAVQLALHGLARRGMKKGAADSAFRHPILRFFLRLMIWVLGAFAIAASWGANIPAFIHTGIGQRLTGGLFSIGVTLIVLTGIYEAICRGIERQLNRQDSEGHPVPASARMRTLLPMLRNTTFVLFSLVVGLVALSEIGINIAPLLAGAGVIGVAIGFGSQTLVKDFLTGLFIVLDNTVAVGDVVKIGDHAGLVESMTMRTIRLRDLDGTVHTLPFSEVSKISNMTKDYSYALFNIGVAYDTDLRKAMDVIRALGEEIRQDPVFRYDITAPIEILGVDQLGDYSITIVARLRTRPIRQWDVKRAFLLRLKDKLDEAGIEIPFPVVTQIHKNAIPAEPRPDAEVKNGGAKPGSTD